MKVKRFGPFAVGVLAGSVWSWNAARAVVIAGEDFDGGAVNLTSSDLPDTSSQTTGGDFFGVGAIGTAGAGTEDWPQGYPSTGGLGVPFAIADDTAADVSGGRAGSPFAADDEGIFGQNRDVNNAFFGVSDNDAIPDNTAGWTFNIAGGSDLVLNIDIGSHIDGDFAYPTDAVLTFTASIDGGPAQTTFTIAPASTPAGFAFRPLDGGANETPLNVLQVTGANRVTKTLAGGGGAAGNTILDKATVSTGLLDTYSTPLTGTGSQLVLTFTGTLNFEALAFDNISVTGIPEPGGLALLSTAGVLIARRRPRAAALGR